MEKLRQSVTEIVRRAAVSGGDCRKGAYPLVCNEPANTKASGRIAVKVIFEQFLSSKH